MAETRIRRDRYAEVGGELPVITRIESSEEVKDRTKTRTYPPNNPHLLTIDQEVRQRTGKLAKRAGFIIERALSARPEEKGLLTYTAVLSKPDLPEAQPNQLWIYADYCTDRDKLWDIDELNRRIQTSPRPQLTTVHVPDRPGLLIARRSIAVGSLLSAALGQLRRFETIQVLPSGPGAKDGDDIFAPGVLVKANIDIFKASPLDAESDLRTLLELETYPVNNSLREPQA